MSKAIKLLCVKGNECISVCTTKNCDKRPFICRQFNCECEMDHLRCRSIRWQHLSEVISSKIKTHKHVNSTIVDRIQAAYHDVFESVNLAYKKFISEIQLLGLSRNQKSFYQKLRQQKYDDITGAVMHELEQSINKQMVVDTKQLDNDLLNIRKLAQYLINYMKHPLKLFPKDVLLKEETQKTLEDKPQKQIPTEDLRGEQTKEAVREPTQQQSKKIIKIEESESDGGYSNIYQSLNQNIRSLYVGRLSPFTTASDLKEHFHRSGKIVNARIMYDRVTGLSRKFGFVEFADFNGVKKGLEMNNTLLRKHIIKVDVDNQNNFDLKNQHDEYCFRRRENMKIVR